MHLYIHPYLYSYAYINIYPHENYSTSKWIRIIVLVNSPCIMYIVYVCKCTYIYIQIHIHMNIYIHSYIYTYICVCTCTGTNTTNNTWTHPHTDKYSHRRKKKVFTVSGDEGAVKSSKPHIRSAFSICSAEMQPVLPDNLSIPVNIFAMSSSSSWRDVGSSSPGFALWCAAYQKRPTSHVKKDLHTWKEIHWLSSVLPGFALWCAACQKRPASHVKRDLHTWKETHWLSGVSPGFSLWCAACQKRPTTHVQRDLRTADPTRGDIFECCFKAQSSKLERLFSLKRGKRDVRALSFELSKMSPPVG